MATPPESDVSSDFNFVLQHADVLDSKMAYVDTKDTHDTTTTAVLIHGNPTSSFIWRNIVPHISPRLRCVAPDLIGMGKSAKPDLDYRFVDHARYLDAFLDAVVPEGKVVLVLQDWGSALGLHWASRHQHRVGALCLMEFIRPSPSWDDMGKGAALEIFKKFRTASEGRQLIIEDNIFLKGLLPNGSARGLAPEEQAYYEAPYPDAKSLEPVYRWPNELPIEGSPEDVYAIAVRYHDWLIGSDVPKLLFWASPGAMVREEHAKWYGENLKNVDVVYLGQGVHYLQEDHPHRIGTEVANLTMRLGLS